MQAGRQVGSRELEMLIAVRSRQADRERRVSEGWYRVKSDNGLAARGTRGRLGMCRRCVGGTGIGGEEGGHRVAVRHLLQRDV